MEELLAPETPFQPVTQDDIKFTGISRSGRVRKRSSKLMDFKSPDELDLKMRPQRRLGWDMMDIELPESDMIEGILTDSDIEMDPTTPASLHSSMESGSSGSDDGVVKPTPANSLYMMEKAPKRKIIVKEGKIIARAKVQRKDKGKTRITAYMMWAKEARNELLKYNPQLNFSSISKRLGEMWSNVNYNERYQWKRKAKRFCIQKDLSNAMGSCNRIITSSAQIGARKGVARMRPAAAAGEPGDLPQGATAVYRVTGCGPLEVAAHLRLLGDSLAIIGARLKEHEGQIAVSGSVSVLLDSWLCSVASLICLFRNVPGLEPPLMLMQDTLHNIAYIMPGL